MVFLIRLLRVEQWSKNLLIFVVPLLAEKFDWALVRIFFAFCCSASFGYVVNDYLDLPKDRTHQPHKPLVQKHLSHSALIVLSGVLLSPALLLSLKWSVAYLLISLGYSFGIKRIQILDMIWLAMGFVIRAYAGAQTVSADISDWFLTTIFFVALFMLAGKRLKNPNYTYDAGFISNLLVMLAGITIILYTLYAFSPATTVKFHNRMFFTVPVVVFGILRYYQLLQKFPKYHDPLKLVISDRQLSFAVLIYISQLFIIIYT